MIKCLQYPPKSCGIISHFQSNVPLLSIFLKPILRPVCYLRALSLITYKPCIAFIFSCVRDTIVSACLSLCMYAYEVLYGVNVCWHTKFQLLSILFCSGPSLHSSLKTDKSSAISPLHCINVFLFFCITSASDSDELADGLKRKHL